MPPENIVFAGLSYSSLGEQCATLNQRFAAVEFFINVYAPIHHCSFKYAA